MASLQGDLQYPLLAFTACIFVSHTVAGFVYVTSRVWQKWGYIISNIRLWKILWLPSCFLSFGLFTLGKVSCLFVSSSPRRIMWQVTGLQDMLKNWMRFLAKRHISELRSGSSSPSQAFGWLQPQSSILSYILLPIFSWKTLSQNHQINHY